MKSKEIDIDRMYLIHCPNKGYYSQDTPAWTNKMDTAVRFTRKDEAELEARILNGTVCEEILTPQMMSRIITAKNQGDSGGKLVRAVLNGLNDSMDSSYYELEPTLGGITVGLDEIMFTAAGRYADILFSASQMMESYYTLLASDYYYCSYDSERDNAGVIEYEVYHQLIQAYEYQLMNFVLLYQTALNYLKRALMHRAGQTNANDRSEAIISLFSDAAVADYQKDPEKCFEQFKQIEAAVPITYELTGKNGR